jgi:hypothetical protein
MIHSSKISNGITTKMVLLLSYYSDSIYIVFKMLQKFMAGSRRRNPSLGTLSALNATERCRFTRIAKNL